MKIKWLVVMMLFPVLNCLAQNITIKGKIVENVNEEVVPVGFSNIVLMKNDSVLVSGTTSGEDGNFVLNNIGKGDYILTVSYIGYSPVGMELKNLSKTIDLGAIELREDSETLEEVAVTATHIIQKIDRQIILPTTEQIRTSYDAYDLLNNMMISRLHVNVISKGMTVSGGGSVQTRINGIKVTDREVASVRAKDIVRVEYIEAPGKQYGEESLGAVINIIVKRQESGGVVNAQTMNAPYMLFGENFLGAKYNYKKSEWGLNVVNINKGYKKGWRDIEETYHLEDKTIERVQEGIRDKRKYFDNEISLSYNLYETDKYVFNAVFRNSIYQKPYEDRYNKLYDRRSPDDFIYSDTHEGLNSYSPSLDVYYQRILPNNQTLEVNVIGTLINTTSERNYQEYTPAQMELANLQTDVEGKKRSIIGEAIYNKEFSKIKLSMGGRHTQVRTENTYTGTNPVISAMDNSQSSAFGELQGKVGSFSYAGSVGFTRSWFKEGGENHEYYIFSPTVRLSVAPHKGGFLRYRFNIEPSIPSLGSLTDVEQPLDTIQIVRGNPRLKTYKIYTNSLDYSYQYQKFNGSLNVNYQYYDNPIMESVFAENNKLIIMDENQRSFQRLNVELNTGLRGISVGNLPNFLTLMAGVGYTDYRSKGNTYEHTYDNFYYLFQGMVSYKDWMFIGMYRKNQNSLYGETIMKGENLTAFMLSYRYKNLQLGAAIMFPFTNNYKTGSERVSEVAPVQSWTYVKETGRLVTLRLAYNFEFGRKYKSGQKNLNNKDTDAGIINTNR